jgi:hypothetical protein
MLICIDEGMSQSQGNRLGILKNAREAPVISKFLCSEGFENNP